MNSKGIGAFVVRLTFRALVALYILHGSGGSRVGKMPDRATLYIQVSGGRSLWNLSELVTVATSKDVMRWVQIWTLLFFPSEAQRAP